MIFPLDLSNLGANEATMVAECDAAEAVIMAEPGNSVLILNDVRGTVGSIEAIKYCR